MEADERSDKPAVPEPTDIPESGFSATGEPKRKKRRHPHPRTSIPARDRRTQKPPDLITR